MPEVFYLKVITFLLGGYGSIATIMGVWVIRTTAKNQKEIFAIKTLCEERHKKSLQSAT